MIISLLLLFVMVLSVSATFAADDVNDVVATDDEIDGGVISTDVDDSSELDDDKLATDDAPIVTKDNFKDYFDDSGVLTSNSSELVFEGDFSDLNVSTIMIAKENPVKFTGKNATFNNVQFQIMQSGVTIDGFNLMTNESNEHSRLIWIVGFDTVSNIVLTNNNITFIAPEGEDAYVIYAGAEESMDAAVISGLDIINNNIIYVGSDATKVNNVIRVNGNTYDEDFDYETSDSIVVQENTFDIAMPAIPMDYDPLTWEMSPLSEAIVFYYCEDVTFSKNKLKLRYNKFDGSYDTINVVSVYSSMMAEPCSDITISDNEIDAIGHSCIYAIKISADDFEISNNVLNITTDEYLAHGISIDGPASNGLVSCNNISLYGNPDNYTTSYGIYAWQTYGSIGEINYVDNVINVEGYLACGMEINQPDEIIARNVINAKGNFTYGIAASIRPDSDMANIEDNTIVCLGNNIGFGSGDAILKTASAGISTLGNAIISSNKINSTAVGIICVEDGEVVLTGNDVNVIAIGDNDNYAIKIDGIEEVNITENNITFVGISDGSVVTNALFVSDVENNVSISDNNFDICIPSIDNQWFEIPSGSGNWVSVSVSEGVVVEDSTGVIFDSNVMNVQFGDVVTSWGYDSIYAVDIKSDDAVITNNNITVSGNDYTYGITVYNNNYTIRANNIEVTANNYAAGIEVNANGLIEDNTISAAAPVIAYGIIPGMSAYGVSVDVVKNNISCDAYYACGISYNTGNLTVADNEIMLDGNYTVGIDSSADNLNVTGNLIVSTASNEGNITVVGIETETSGINVKNGKASIKNNRIATAGVGIAIDGASEVNIVGNFINVVAADDLDAFAIYAMDIDDLSICENYIDYQGTTQGTGINNAIYLNNATGAVISANNFTLELISIDNQWFEIPSGSGNWVSVSVSEGVVVEDSTGVIFDSNVMNVQFGDVVTSWGYDSIYAVDIKSDDAVITNNNITVSGNDYTYGITVYGDNYVIRANNINVTANNYAAGIEVNANGLIEDNTISAAAPVIAYGIIPGMSAYGVSVDVVKNNISCDAYYACGISYNSGNLTVENNNIIVNGNYTVGIDSSADNLNVTENVIISNASNEGNMTVVGIETVTSGINVNKGVANIFKNDITSTGDVAIDLGNTNSTVENNKLIANKAVGDDAIASTGNATIKGNKAYVTKLSGADVSGSYGDVTYSVTLTYENGTPIANKNIEFSIDNTILSAVTNANGVASVKIDLGMGDYKIIASYSGEGYDIASSTTNNVSISIKATALDYKKSVTVLITAVKKGSYYKIVLKDVSGNVLANKQVTIVFNGKNSNFTTNSKGVISYKLSANKASSYKLTINFAGDNCYAATNGSATVKINKEASKVVAKKKTFKAKKKTKKYTATLKDSKGKAIKKVKVTLKIKGKKAITAKTNKKGKVTFKIKNLKKKGKYTAKITFAGNKLYKASKKSVKITVKK